MLKHNFQPLNRWGCQHLQTNMPDVLMISGGFVLKVFEALLSIAVKPCQHIFFPLILCNLSNIIIMITLGKVILGQTIFLNYFLSYNIDFNFKKWPLIKYLYISDCLQWGLIRSNFLVIVMLWCFFPFKLLAKHLMLIKVVLF